MSVVQVVLGLVLIAGGVGLFLARTPLDRWNADTAMKMQVGPAKNQDLGRHGSYVAYFVVAAIGLVVTGVGVLVLGLS